MVRTLKKYFKEVPYFDKGCKTGYDNASFLVKPNLCFN